MLNPARQILRDYCPLYYPFGNTKGRNVLEEFTSSADAEIIEILFLGCGDIRNAIQTKTKNPTQHFRIHLNDRCPSVLARNTVLLKILSSTDFNPAVEEDFSFMWDVWYNAEWAETTRRRFLVVLQELLDNDLPENVTFPKVSHLQCLHKIWKTWWLILSRQPSESELLIKQTREERMKTIVDGYGSENLFEDADDKDNDLIFLAGNRFVEFLDAHVGMEDFVGLKKDSSVNRKIDKDFRLYFETGSCHLQNEVITVCVNT